MKLRWNIEKERKLQNEDTRNSITFADCAVAISDGRVLDMLPHPTLSHQRQSLQLAPLSEASKINEQSVRVMLARLGLLQKPEAIWELAGLAKSLPRTL